MGDKKRKSALSSASECPKKARYESFEELPISVPSPRQTEHLTTTNAKMSMIDDYAESSTARTESDSVATKMNVSFLGSAPVVPTGIRFPHLEELVSQFQKVSEAFKDRSEIEIPDTVNIMKFAECRAVEIATLMKEIEQKQPKQSVQQLPRHMRRRAASHNVKRVPRRLRAKAEKEISKAKKSKRPSRKHRRRPSNLLTEYHRRARKDVWLETHIWFAKRFRMEKLWGYWIPVHPNDKNRRSSYKATTHFTMLQDMSYMCCTELFGPPSLLLPKLSRLTDPSTGLTFAAKAYRNGQKEGSTVLYHPESFPFRAIGPITFVWQPSKASLDSDEIQDQKLWIWCHPVMHQELVGVLKSLFDLQEVNNSTNEIHVENEGSIELEGSEAALKKVDGIKKNETFDENAETKSADDETKLLDPKFSNRFRKYIQYSGDNVVMTVLKDNLIRYRLIGPKSQAIIADTLKAAEIAGSDCDDGKWWEEYYLDESNRNVFENQKDFFEKMSGANSPAEVPSRIVLGLTVKDPRLDLPPVKTSVKESYNETFYSRSLFEASSQHFLADSPIWDLSTREKVTATKIPESELNRMRSRYLVPGSKLQLGREESRIPVLVIQQPDIRGYGAGWDVIAPLGWGMAFWIAFVYRGARAFGLRELKSFSRDSAHLMPPCNYPDTECGKLWQEKNRMALMEKHFRYPPAKRPSFKKLGVLNPFFMPWEILISEYTKEIVEKSTNSFYVLRSKKQLNLMRELCDLMLKLSRQKFNQNRKDKALASKSINDLEALLTSNSLNIKTSIVCIELKSLFRGNVYIYSGVYMPDQSDLLELSKNMKYTGPTEKIHFVEKTSEKKKKRKRRKRKELPDESEKSSKANEKLQIPVIANLTTHCSRKLIGYVESGGYSYHLGCGYGIGHCAIIPLVETLKMCLDHHLPPLVLVRSQSNLQYRPCIVNVNIHI